MKKNDPLRLENQLCFPLYVCAREIVNAYRPLLEQIGLTYTQYIAMMVMWEEEEITVKKLGRKLRLDSGTLTPVLKKLETAGYVIKKRSTKDERVVVVTITEQGKALKRKAATIPEQMVCCLSSSRKKMDSDEMKALYDALYKFMDILEHTTNR